jgi:prolyl-tRNA synthetase
MFKVTEDFLSANTTHANDMGELLSQLKENDGFVSCYWLEDKDDELKVKELTKATIRCYPLENTEEKLSVNKPDLRGRYAIFSKSY